MMFDFTASIVLYKHTFNELKDTIIIFNNLKHKCLLYLIDNSKQKIHISDKYYKNIEYIHTGKNLGYGKAQNVALKKIIKNSHVHFFFKS